MKLATSKVFNAQEGYSVDQQSGRCIFAYRENVPSWWGIRARISPKLAPALGLAGFLFSPRKEIPFAIVGGLAGAIWANQYPAWIICAAIGATAGYYLGRYLSRGAASLPPLTGKPDLSGIVTDFQTQVEVDRSGNVLVYRELHASDPKSASSYQPTSFQLTELASIERKTWDEIYPDEKRNPTSAPGKKARAEVRDLQKVVFVFRDGQIGDAGWKRSSNAAARLQADLLSFLDELGSHVRKQRVDADRLSRIAPGDAPL